MIQVRIFNEDEFKIQEKINDWLKFKQEDLKDKFKLVDIKLSAGEPPKKGYHNQMIIGTITYNDNYHCPSEITSNPKPGLGQW